jgi:ribosomal protein S18 acetylase RimI-like enzyme
MRLTHVSQNHVLQMMSWFNHTDYVFSWVGPGFRYPFTHDSFTEDLKLDTSVSYFLVTHDGELAGFGQCDLRHDKCHLGRLLIAPHFRRQSYQIGRFVSLKVSHILIHQLIELGCQKLGVEPAPGSVSLFVLNHNLAALNLYLSLGFVESLYPEPIPIDNCIYMIK